MITISLGWVSHFSLENNGVASTGQLQWLVPSNSVKAQKTNVWWIYLFIIIFLHLVILCGLQFTQPDLPGYMGFANLPNQVHRKSVKKGFEFTLMVAGVFSCYFYVLAILMCVCLFSSIKYCSMQC